MNQDMEKIDGSNGSQNFVPMKEYKEDSSTINNIENNIAGSPFSIVTTNKEEENKCFIALGNRRLSEFMPYEICDEMIQNKDWTLITQLCLHMLEHQEDIKKITELHKKGGM